MPLGSRYSLGFWVAFVVAILTTILIAFCHHFSENFASDNHFFGYHPSPAFRYKVDDFFVTMILNTFYGHHIGYAFVRRFSHHASRAFDHEINHFLFSILIIDLVKVLITFETLFLLRF